MSKFFLIVFYPHCSTKGALTKIITEFNVSIEILKYKPGDLYYMPIIFPFHVAGTEVFENEFWRMTVYNVKLT